MVIFAGNLIQFNIIVQELMICCYEALYIHNKMFVLFFLKKYLYLLINLLNYFISQYRNNYIRIIK